MSRKSRANKADQQATLAVEPTPEQTEQPVTEIAVPARDPQPGDENYDETTAGMKPISDEPAARRGGSVIKAAYKKTHVLDGLAQAVSAAVRGDDNRVDLGLLTALADHNGLDAGRWAHLNPGMQVMALTNTLRARERTGEPVVLSLEPAEVDKADAA